MGLNIEVYSDVICPWCYLGKKRLELALKSLPGSIDVVTHFLPYELNPFTPEEGLDHQAHLVAKFGSPQRLEAVHGRLTELGKEAGIDYRFNAIQKTPNTFNAHRVLWLADQEGVQNRVADAFFAGYFSQGLDLGNKKVLADLASQAGLSHSKVEKLFQANQGAEEVRVFEEKANNMGISGVPFFIFYGSPETKGKRPIGVSGAQDPQVFKDVLSQAGI